MSDERALTWEKEQEVGPKGVPVYREDDLRAALELLREKFDKLSPIFLDEDITRLNEMIDSAFPVFVDPLVKINKELTIEENKVTYDDIKHFAHFEEERLSESEKRNNYYL